MFALRVMRECGLQFTGGVEQYRQVLKVLEGEAETKKQVKYGTDEELQKRVK